ncbi:MAG: CPBP family intramembrane metalloprotease [Desulfosarcinaceae bacterium]|nr:CPBP family intramembrane metalloprotease [Desulfosarcinaceae bacterium]
MRLKRGYLAVECALLFFIAPAALYFIRFAVAFKIIPLVMGVALICGYYLVRYCGYGRRELWLPQNWGRQLAGVIVTFIPLATLLTLLAWYHIPGRFFAFPRHTPHIWAAVMILYPVLAAYPQELFYRAFFFERYRPLFGSAGRMILFNALSFGVGHALYGNWIAPVLSTLGGLLFAYRYWRSGSTFVVGVEHALWGNLIFTSGYGWYFYSGAIQ